MQTTKKCLFILLASAYFGPIFSGEDQTGHLFEQDATRRGTNNSLEVRLARHEADPEITAQNLPSKATFSDLENRVKTIEETLNKQNSPWFKFPSLPNLNPATRKAFGFGLFSYALAGLNYFGGGYLVSDRYGSKICQHVTTAGLIGAGTAYTSVGISSALGNENWQSRFNKAGNWLLAGSLLSLGAGQCGGQVTAQLAKNGSAWAAHNGSYYANQIAKTIKNYRKN